MGLKRLRWLSLLLAMVLYGCSSVKEELKPVPLQPIDAKLRLKPSWKKDVGAGQDARYQRLQPVHAEGIMYTVDVNGKLTAVKAENGRRVWTSSVGKEVGGGIGLSGQVGFVGTLDGHVVAFSTADGQILWQSKVSSEVVSAPQSNGSVVIAVAIDGRVHAFDVETGKEIWNYDHPTPILSLRSTSSPLVTDSSAVISFDNGQLLSFDIRTGKLAWSARIGQPQGKTELERLVDSDSSPKAYGPYIYSAGYNTRLIAVAQGSGRIAWAQDVSTYNEFVISDNVVVVVEADSHVRAFDASTGSVLWENDELHRRSLSAPGIIGSVVFVVDAEGYVHGLSLESGEIVGRSRLSDGAVLAQPIAVQDNIFFYDLMGNLSAYSLEVGKFKSTIWDLPTDRDTGAIPTKYTGVKKAQ